MAALEKEFVVAEIMQVPRGSALRGFPEFPRAGTLVILSPPSEVADKELNGHAAEVTAGGSSRSLRYAYWQVNDARLIGLLCEPLDESVIPLGSRVRFVLRPK